MNGSIDVSTLTAFLSLAVGGGALLIPIVAQGFKKLFGLNSGFVIHTMVFALAVIQAGAQYGLQVHGQLPIIIPGVSPILIYGASQLIYRNTGYLKTVSGFLSRVQISLTPTATAPVLAGAVATEPVLSQTGEAQAAAPEPTVEPNPADIAPSDQPASEFNA